MEWLFERAAELEAAYEQELRKNSELMAIVTQQAKELDRAWRKVGLLRKSKGLMSSLLAGHRIAVVGPSFREQTYRQLVASLGGRFLFAPSDEKIGKLDRVVCRAELVIFITSYTSHKASYLAEGASKRYDVPIVWTEKTGIDQLETLIISEAKSCFPDLSA